jgi:hypothetical protein
LLPYQLVYTITINGIVARFDSTAGRIRRSRGHYRKALLRVNGVGTLKVYLPKAREFSEGESLGVRPLRYLIYRDNQLPVEVKLRAHAAVA